MHRTLVFVLVWSRLICRCIFCSGALFIIIIIIINISSNIIIIEMVHCSVADLLVLAIASC